MEHEWDYGVKGGITGARSGIMDLKIEIKGL